MYNAKNNLYNFNNFIILYYSDYEIIILLFGSKLWLLPNCGNASKFSYLKNFNNEKYIIQT